MATMGCRLPALKTAAPTWAVRSDNAMESPTQASKCLEISNDAFMATGMSASLFSVPLPPCWVERRCAVH
jgi:hypothetical protein